MLLENHGRSLLIRAASEQDAAWLAQTFADEAFMALYCSNAGPQNEENLRANLIERSNTPAATLGFIEFIILDRHGERIGLCALGGYTAIHRRAEVLIGIVDPALRHGTAAVEATLLLLDLAFNHYQLNKLFSYVYGYNEYSERNTVKLGFTQEGLLREHHFQTHEKRFVDLYINGLTLRDFRAGETIARLSKRLVGRDITLAPTPIMGTDLDLSKADKNKLLAGLFQYQQGIAEQG